MNLIFIFILSLVKTNFKKLLIISSSALITKIISDPRNTNVQIKDLILKIKLNLILKNNKIINKNSKIIIYVYKNKIILLGQTKTLDNFNKIKNIIKNNIKNKNIKIFNKIKFRNKKTFKNSIKDKFNFIKLNFILLNFSITKLSNIKIIVENNEIFLIGICNRKESINLIQLIQFFFKKHKIIPALIHNDYIIIKNK